MDIRLRTKMVSKANHHWDWLGRLFELVDFSKNQIKIIEYVYKTAFLHGAKHAEEELKDEYSIIKQEGPGGVIFTNLGNAFSIIDNMENTEGGGTDGTSRGSEETDN